MRIFFAAAVLLTVVAAPASAQVAPTTDSQVAPTTDSSVRKVGERITRDQAAENITPRARIDNRIQNRVQNRLRNRIDRNYDPLANATSPFKVADDKAQTTTQRTR